MKKKEEEEKAKTHNRASLDEALAEIKQKFGEGAIMNLRDAKAMDVEAISTGSVSLDQILGVGGFPRGRVIEVFGPESSGKTTIALHLCAQAQKDGGVAAFIDAEHALDPDYANRIGVNISDLLISQPDSGEQALQIVEALAESGGVDVIVVDSVAALTPKAEIAGEIGDFQIGLQARLMSSALRKLSSIVSRSKTVVLFLNQTRMKIGVIFGNPETTPGGMALKFYSSVRLEVRRAAQIKQGESIIGNRVRAKVIKNKVAPPFRTTEFDIYYNEGISYAADLLNVGVKQGTITKAGSWYQFGEIKIGQGTEGVKVFLKENPKVAEEIKKIIIEKI
jgi:recombination protein RecA